jgi:hypothetical protein
MPVGYMSGSKRARYASSISNQTSIFGDMGGLAPRVNATSMAVYKHKQRKATNKTLVIPSSEDTTAKQITYLKDNNLVSVNPATSGGVGRRSMWMRFN